MYNTAIYWKEMEVDFPTSIIVTSQSREKKQS